jgi:Trypsin
LHKFHNFENYKFKSTLAHIFALMNRLKTRLMEPNPSRCREGREPGILWTRHRAWWDHQSWTAQLSKANVLKKVSSFILRLICGIVKCVLIYTENAGRANPKRPSKQFFTSSVTGSLTPGSTSILGQQPWQASLNVQKGPFSFSKSIRFCSGSLVDYNWLATSASCARYIHNI